METHQAKLQIAFESRQLTYSDLPVDLYNSGVNQILSVAASRGHQLYHFSMADLYSEVGLPHARMSLLELQSGWVGDPLHACRGLHKVGERLMPCGELDICFLRGDDVRHEDTPNMDVLQEVERHCLLFENVEPTLSTCDKFKLVQRVPEVPQPVTFYVQSVEDALRCIQLLPNNNGWFVVKDRYGYGCGAQVHRLKFDDPDVGEKLGLYLADYRHLLIQEFCPEVYEGDLVVTFFDGELLGTMIRHPAPDQWKTNASLGATQQAYTLPPHLEEIAGHVAQAFAECRCSSVDMMLSGKVLEINAFPGGEGLHQVYNLALGEMIMNRLESEMLEDGSLRFAVGSRNP